MKLRGASFENLKMIKVKTICFHTINIRLRKLKIWYLKEISTLGINLFGNGEEWRIKLNSSKIETYSKVWCRSLDQKLKRCGVFEKMTRRLENYFSYVFSTVWEAFSNRAGQKKSWRIRKTKYFKLGGDKASSVGRWFTIYTRN